MNGIRRLAWLPVAAAATPAHAHSPVPGIEGFYVGLLHPFSTPSQVLLMVGLGLVAGAFATERARWLLAGFLVASFAGLIFGPGILDLDPLLFAMAFATCALAALAPNKLAPLAITLLGIGGYLIGKASIPDDGPMRDRLFTMSGSIVGANLGLLYLYGFNTIVRERYTWDGVGIAFRVIAAWVGAIALLMLALGFVDVPAPHDQCGTAALSCTCAIAGRGLRAERNAIFLCYGPART
ncbi:MAG: HupE/UreJ family protein [Pseudomonadota bacterium]